MGTQRCHFRRSGPVAPRTRAPLAMGPLQAGRRAGIAKTSRELKENAKSSGKVVRSGWPSPADWWGAGSPSARSAGDAALRALSAGLGLRGAKVLNSASDNPRSAKLTREDKRRKKPDPESRKGGGRGEERGSGTFISQSTKAS